MGKMLWTPDGGQSVDIGKWAPGIESEIAGKWRSHEIPGLQGNLEEDHGDGALGTNVTLQFPRASDYGQVMAQIFVKRSGYLQHPRRGSRRSVIKRVRERVQWTTGGESTVVDLTFGDAALDTTNVFPGGPNVVGQQAIAQAQIADSKVEALRKKIFGLSKYNRDARARIVQAQTLVSKATSEIRAYVGLALAFYGTASDAFFFVATLPQEVTNQFIGLLDQITSTTQATVVTWQQLTGAMNSLPDRVEAAEKRLRAAWGQPGDTQPACVALEMALAQATATDAAIRAAQPVPIETPVTRAPGQSIYAFVQQWYGGRGLSPSKMRALASSILVLNRDIRPDLIPMGTVVLRPAL